MNMFCIAMFLFRECSHIWTKLFGRLISFFLPILCYSMLYWFRYVKMLDQQKMKSFHPRILRITGMRWCLLLKLLCYFRTKKFSLDTQSTSSYWTYIWTYLDCYVKIMESYTAVVGTRVTQFHDCWPNEVEREQIQVWKIVKSYLGIVG